MRISKVEMEKKGILTPFLFEIDAVNVFGFVVPRYLKTIYICRILKGKEELKKVKVKSQLKINKDHLNVNIFY